VHELLKTDVHGLVVLITARSQVPSCLHDVGPTMSTTVSDVSIGAAVPWIVLLDSCTTCPDMSVSIATLYSMSFVRAAAGLLPERSACNYFLHGHMQHSYGGDVLMQLPACTECIAQPAQMHHMVNVFINA
jgi:hypothetical protein